ncbi:MAG TPA: DUF1549 and DUF1553 domain-containing protein [Fimbriiglobus sp.]|nr:DUF1549 and DUF1553 domain-containing protein [Fimbriiglobus sp.]
MRRAASLLFATLAFVIGGVAVERIGLAADQPKSKQQAKKEQLKKFKAKQAARQKAKQAAKRRAEAEDEKASAAKPVEPPKRATPNPSPAAAVAQMIDEHIDRKLAEAKVPAGPAASDDEFLRRAYLDLTGVIPTAAKTRAFLDSTDPQKRAKLIDELLASETYGKHQADLWVPKLFPRDSANRFVLREPLAKWFADQFNADTRWDKLVYDLVTASGTVADNPAVTYYLANRSVDKLTDTVTQHFLGVQLQCAQCHNHPFNAWKQTEYWGMAAFFSKVQPQNPRNPNRGGDAMQVGVRELPVKSRLRNFFPDSAKDVPPKFLGGPEPKLASREPYRPELAEWMTGPRNPYFARAMVNRTWGQLFGRGFVNPIEDMGEGAIASHPELLDALTREFVKSGFDVKHLTRCICASQAYQRTSKPSGSEADPALFARMAVKVMTPEQLFDSLGRVTGFDRQMERARARAPKRPNAPTPRDQFVQFYLAGAEQAHPTEYEGGIPQALKLMNSRIVGNPAAVRSIAPPGTKPAEAFEAIYLAALSRRPTGEEVTRLKEYAAKAGTPNEAYGDILWVVLNSSEFTAVR